jgi:bla regulator protein BlaR1
MAKPRAVSVALFLAIALPLACAQTAATPPVAIPAATQPAYDVFTIKLNKSGSGSSGAHSGGDSFTATNITLRQLLQLAFSIRQDLIFDVPSTIDSARFDIQAKVVDPDLDAIRKLSARQNGAMLLPLLTECFHLKTHPETRTLPVYELVVIPGGPKFKPTPSDAHGSGTHLNGRNDHTDLTAQNLTMALFADILSDQVQRTVIDKTALAGNYDLTLQFSREDSRDANLDTAPSIFTALPEQLGLKLQPAKGPVETLVVDHIEMPSEN